MAEPSLKEKIDKRKKALEEVMESMDPKPKKEEPKDKEPQDKESKGSVSKKNSMMVKKHLHYSETLAKD